MNILFRNTTDITKREIITFNYFNLYTNKLLMVILLYMPVIWIISGVGMFISDQANIRRLIVSLVISIAWLLLIFLPPYISVKINYKNEDYVNEYSFYEGKLRAENKFLGEDISYSSLYKVYETKKYFYFYVNKKSALIMKKDKFDIGNEEEFANLIKEKIGKKFKKTRII